MELQEISFGTHIEKIIGDFQQFFSDLLKRIEKRGIDIAERPIVQLLYRTETFSEYEEIRDQLKTFCKAFVETLFNGRAVSILMLKEPLLLERGYSVSVIELPAPRPVHMYPSGLESVGVLIGNRLPEFKQTYKEKLTGIKEHGKHCQPAFVTFENEKTLKFYDYSLEEIIYLQGWRFEPLLLPQESPAQKMAKLVNAWQWYFHGDVDWKELIRGQQPKSTQCGCLYELPIPIDRPDESFAILDLRKPTQYQHPDTKVYIVLEGSGSITLNGSTEHMQKDATVIAPPNTSHFILPQNTLILAAISPLRQQHSTSRGCN